MQVCRRARTGLIQAEYMRELLVDLRDRIRVLEEENNPLRSWPFHAHIAVFLVVLFAVAAFSSRGSVG